MREDVHRWVRRSFTRQQAMGANDSPPIAAAANDRCGYEAKLLRADGLPRQPWVQLIPVV